jgi:hypothetical protein
MHIDKNEMEMEIIESSGSATLTWFLDKNAT